jgi:hypothetical protein
VKMSNAQQRILINSMKSLPGVPHERLQPFFLDEHLVMTSGTSNNDNNPHHPPEPPRQTNLYNTTNTLPSSSSSYQSPCSLEKHNRTTEERKVNKLKLPFPWKLNQLLDDLESYGRQDIASWLPGGNSFRIHNPEVFSKVVMCHYFRQTKFASFVRQVRLNRYFIQIPGYYR